MYICILIYTHIYLHACVLLTVLPTVLPIVCYSSYLVISGYRKYYQQYFNILLNYEKVEI